MRVSATISTELEVEGWSWPPRYDPHYHPEQDQPHWFPRRETMDVELRNELILERIRELMAYAFERAPFYRRKWEGAGLHPHDIRSLEDFQSVPPVTKEELRRDQEEQEPFGSYLCIPEHEVHHVHGTSGTTGRPTAFGIARRDWDAIANAHARVMWSMGIRPHDTVFVASLLSLYMGSWGALLGAERLGAASLPFGAGVPGQSRRAVNWLRTMRPTVLYATPSYALRLAEVAAELSVDPKEFGLRILFFSGEPGASVPSVRRRLEETYSARVFDSGSMAEASPWMSLGETEASGGMLCWQDLVYTEVVDPSSCRKVPFGQEGTLVYTTLERTSQPMIRLLSNDLTRWEAGPSPCGRTYPILPRGIYGRIDDMFTVRGENVYPSAIDDVVNSVDGYGGEHRIVVCREDTMDELTVQVEYAGELEAAGAEAVAAWQQRVSQELQTVLGVRAVVQPVSPGTLKRTELKARRVIDDRALLQQVRTASQPSAT